jgi:hypothetical protein
VGKKINPGGKGKYRYFQGSYQIKNDTAYATTYPDDDQIKVFGSRSDTVPEGNVEVYLRDLDSQNIKLKVGKVYTNSSFISSDQFNNQRDSLSSVQLKKADSLWVAVGPQSPIIYSYGIKRMKNNAILIQPNPSHTLTWIKHPIYVSKKNEIHNLLSPQNVLTLKAGKRIPAPVAATPPHPTLQEKRYYPIQRNRIFKISKKH